MVLLRSSLLTMAYLLMAASIVGAQQFTRLIECVSPSPGVYCIWVEPELSPDGNWIAFTSGTTWPPHYEWWPSVAIVSADGNSSIPLMGVTLNGWTFNPSWSPNGTHLAFVADGFDVGESGIWVVDLADPQDMESYELLPNTAGASALAWSRDEHSIAYVASSGIWVTNLEAGTSLVIPGGWDPSWAADGALVFVQSNDLWIRETDGGVRQLTDTPWKETAPAWSPAGTWIAYAADQHGSWDIWVIASTGGTAVRVTSQAADELQPSWSGDSQSLLYHSYLQNDEFWLATNLPDFTVSISQRSWSQVKQLFK